MGKSENRVQDFIADVRSGMDASVLKKKYDLTSDKFDSYQKMALDLIAKGGQPPKVKRKIDPHQLLADIRSGMDSDSLMAKYGLTGLGLKSACRKIVQAGMASALEISDRIDYSENG